MLETAGRTLTGLPFSAKVLSFFLNIGEASANLKFSGKFLSRISSFQIFVKRGLQIPDVPLRQPVEMFLKVPSFYQSY